MAHFIKNIFLYCSHSQGVSGNEETKTTTVNATTKMFVKISFYISFVSFIRAEINSLYAKMVSFSISPHGFSVCSNYFIGILIVKLVTPQLNLF